MAAAFRELLGFDRLGLSSTWLETLEQPPEGAGDLAHQLDGEIDAFFIDPSMDLYGGGGLVMTMGDLARFMHALFTGAVFDDPATLSVMLTTIDTSTGMPGAPDAARDLDYRMGIWVAEIDGIITYRHTGYWGTTATYAPSLDLAIAATVNQHQAKQTLGELERQVLAQVRDALGADAI